MGPLESVHFRPLSSSIESRVLSRRRLSESTTSSIMASSSSPSSLRHRRSHHTHPHHPLANCSGHNPADNATPALPISSVQNVSLPASSLSSASHPLTSHNSSSNTDRAANESDDKSLCLLTRLHRSRCPDAVESSSLRNDLRTPSAPLVLLLTRPRRPTHSRPLLNTSFILVTTLVLTLMLQLHGPLVAAEENKIYHISTLCLGDRPAPLYKKIDGAVLTSESENKLDCIVTFQTDSILQRFMLRFERLALDCNDHLYIYDGAHAYGKATNDLSCRSTRSDVGTIFTESNYVTLRYVTDDWSNEGNGFQLVITAYKDQSVACSSLKCKNEYCIPKDLACDSVNHCGDNSDEMSCIADGDGAGGLGRVWGVEGHILLLLLISVFIVCVICVMCVAVCLCRRDLASRQRHLNHMYLNGTLPNGMNGTMSGMNGQATVSLAAGPYGSQRFVLQNTTSSPALAAAHETAAYLNQLAMMGASPTGALMGGGGGGVLVNGGIGMNGLGGMNGTPTNNATRFSTLPLHERNVANREKPPPYSPVMSHVIKWSGGDQNNL